MRYEFKVIPAPRRGEKARGVKTGEDRFALALTNQLNALAAEGWDFVRAESLPLDERSGLTGTKTSMQNLLVFRRDIPGDETSEPEVETAPRLGGASDAVMGAAPALGPAKSN